MRNPVMEMQQIEININKAYRPKKSLISRLLAQKELQLMVIPGILLLIVFKYLPIYGLQLAFKSFDITRSIWESEWVGFQHFYEFFTSPYFGEVMRNTVGISLLKIVFTFPVPIIFALLLNEIESSKARSFVQGISYLPHFISWVVCYGLISVVISKDGGTINSILLNLGLIEEPIHFIGESKYFWPILIITDNWKEMGWGAIIYMAAISGVDPQIYESAEIDGANRLQKTIYITIPSILPTIVIMLVLRMGSILEAGFDQIFVFRNPMVGDVSNIIDTYVYDAGIKQGRYDYATAIGMFKSVVAFFMVWASNWVANKNEMGIW